MIVHCRDCGELGDEDPEDPAPAICPDCYDKRLRRVFEGLVPLLEGDVNPFEICRVFEKRLVEIGGETPEFARTHAKQMLVQMLFGELSPN